jgi:hypothetical protein
VLPSCDGHFLAWFGGDPWARWLTDTAPRRVRQDLAKGVAYFSGAQALPIAPGYAFFGGGHALLRAGVPCACCGAPEPGASAAARCAGRTQALFCCAPWATLPRSGPARAAGPCRPSMAPVTSTSACLLGAPPLCFCWRRGVLAAWRRGPSCHSCQPVCSPPPLGDGTRCSSRATARRASYYRQISMTAAFGARIAMRKCALVYFAPALRLMLLPSPAPRLARWQGWRRCLRFLCQLVGPLRLRQRAGRRHRQVRGSPPTRVLISCTPGARPAT